MNNVVVPMARRNGKLLDEIGASVQAYALSGRGDDPFGAVVYVTTPGYKSYELIFTADQLGTLLARARRFQREAK